MNIQISSLIPVLFCSVCSAAFAEDGVAKDKGSPGDSVTKEESRTVYSTKGLKSEPKNLNQYQPVTQYLGVEIEPVKRRRRPDRSDRGSGGGEGRRDARDKSDP